MLFLVKLTLYLIHLKFTLGGIEEAFKLKNDQRLKFKLEPISENPSVIINQMSPATPPPNPIGKINF